MRATRGSMLLICSRYSLRADNMAPSAAMQTNTGQCKGEHYQYGAATMASHPELSRRHLQLYVEKKLFKAGIAHPTDRLRGSHLLKRRLFGHCLLQRCGIGTTPTQSN